MHYIFGPNCMNGQMKRALNTTAMFHPLSPPKSLKRKGKNKLAHRGWPAGGGWGDGDHALDICLVAYGGADRALRTGRGGGDRLDIGARVRPEPRRCLRRVAGSALQPDGCGLLDWPDGRRVVGGWGYGRAFAVIAVLLAVCAAIFITWGS